MAPKPVQAVHATVGRKFSQNPVLHGKIEFVALDPYSILEYEEDLAEGPTRPWTTGDAAKSQVQPHCAWPIEELKLAVQWLADQCSTHPGRWYLYWQNGTGFADGNLLFARDRSSHAICLAHSDGETVTIVPDAEQQIQWFGPAWAVSQ